MLTPSCTPKKPLTQAILKPPHQKIHNHGAARSNAIMKASPAIPGPADPSPSITEQRSTSLTPPALASASPRSDGHQSSPADRPPPCPRLSGEPLITRSPKICSTRSGLPLATAADLPASPAHRIGQCRCLPTTMDPPPLFPIGAAIPARFWAGQI
jgi:hypothetical protein